MAKDENMSSHMAAGQLQQRPTAREGGLFKRAWFANPVRFVDRERLQLVRAWDLAWTADSKSDPDYSVGVLMGIDHQTRALYVIDVIRKRLSPADLERTVVTASIFDGPRCLIRIPQDPGVGKFVARYLANKLPGCRVSIEPEHKSKEARAAPFAAQCEMAMVKLVEGQWNQVFIDELCAFPNGAHDDQVDAATAAFRALAYRAPAYAVAA
jgi:predicted phage terminase large subunit-like protein